MRSYPNSSSSLIFDSKQFCTPGLNGQLCIVEGSTWTMKEDLDARPSFFAPRPPLGVAIPNLAKAINTDINFRVPEYYTRGVGDTYFSGKYDKFRKKLPFYYNYFSNCFLFKNT